MKKTIFVVVFSLFLAGCATTEYYTNPSSEGYYQQGLGGLCQSCNRQFAMSGYQLNNIESITCPYCGMAQNTRMAANRWNYAIQQQQAYNNQQALANFASNMQQIQQQHAEKRQQIILDHMSKTSNQPTTTLQPTIQPGDSPLNPIYIKKVDDNY